MDTLPPTPSRGRRLACMLYEAVLLFGVVFVADYLFDTLTQSRNALMLRHERQAWLFLVIGVYFLLCWRASGQTLPMKTWNIRLVDAAGGRPALWKLLARYVLAWPFMMTGLGWLWSFFDRDRQFPQDRLLGTRLVSTR